ncbi:MAG: hypothetical protein DI587_36660 [Variovorax paradoxus]|nr:MAG: hypothetical protein DI583_36660 [Variovorax paradoxus]PZQ00495.1 MAG: hypothetical protein DI587_36660 [Variovorax paradoxus]
MVVSARHVAARNVNALMTASYWAVGRRIVEFEQGGQGRAAYGEELIKQLGADFSRQFGRGFGRRNLAKMRSFHLSWPTEQILQTVSAQWAPPRISQTASAISPTPRTRNTPSGSSHDIAAPGHGWAPSRQKPPEGGFVTER